jgi:dienelactone hydrolase
VPACFDQDMSESLTADTVHITGDAGDDIEAYLASPLGEGPRGGVVVIHHLPGYDRATKEIVRRFAELGYDAICPNLYWREAPTTGWSEMWPAPSTSSGRCRRPTAGWG